MLRKFTYRVTATVWTSGGIGKPWHGEVTIPVRADSSDAFALLQEAVAAQALPWLRAQGETPSNKIDLREWGPKR